LAEGGRLKLEHNGKLKYTSKAKPNFDIQLADIGGYDVVPTEELLNYSDNENLPEPSEIVKSSKWTSSETDYAISDIDVLIRNAPIEQHWEQKEPADSKTKGSREISPKARNPDDLHRLLLFTPSPYLKRPGGSQDTSRGAKRLKLYNTDRKALSRVKSPAVCTRLMLNIRSI
jgi:hypothetical protein